MNVYLSYILALLFSLGQFGCSLKQIPQAVIGKQDPLVVFLVRHAEKADLTRDPELSKAGKERTLELAKVLRSANIQYVHSSDYIRTKETAAPTANEFGLTAEIYDPGDLEALAQKIRKKGGQHLIVGHSDTTPKMVKLLGGDPGPAINEAGEFDRLYIVHVFENGLASSMLLRYGTPYNESTGN